VKLLEQLMHGNFLFLPLKRQNPAW
jgi:hypothetical protein